MKIVTINVPESYVDVITKLVGENGLYPSRSELIRAAVRDFLLREIDVAKNVEELKKDIEFDDYDPEKIVRIPYEKLDEEGEPIREFKTYKIVKRLEY